MSHLQMAGFVLLVVAAYLLGSIPFGYLIARRHKDKNGKPIDIRKVGSCNTGATNVYRVLGINAAIEVAALDILKGFVPTLVCNLWLGKVSVVPAAVCLIAAAIGHSYSIYFKRKGETFSGGKAVATFFGGVAAIQPIVALIALAVWLAMLAIDRRMSVASMIAGISTPLTAHYLLHLGPFWVSLFAFVAVFIVYKHMRNLTRILSGDEPRIWGDKIIEGEKLTAFCFHPQSPMDMAQSKVTLLLALLFKWGILPENVLRFILLHGRVLECGSITKTETPNGIKSRILLYGIPLLPDQIIDHQDLAKDLLVRTVVLAERRGAEVLGFGGLLSTIFKMKKASDNQVEKTPDDIARERGYTIRCDNGAAYTAAATIEALNITLRRLGRDPEAQVVAVIGAKGAIGSPVYQALDKEGFKEVIAVLKDKRAKPRSGEIQLKNVIETGEKDKLSQADIIISATSSAKHIFNKENCTEADIKHGAIILDVAYPPDVDPEIKKIRKDITLIRCGFILLPGDYHSPINFHFGSKMVNGKKKILVPACLAQSNLLVLSNQPKRATLLPAREEDVLFFAEQAKIHGFQVIPSSKSEADIYAGLAEGIEDEEEEVLA